MVLICFNLKMMTLDKVWVLAGWPTATRLSGAHQGRARGGRRPGGICCLRASVRSWQVQWSESGPGQSGWRQSAASLVHGLVRLAWCNGPGWVEPARVGRLALVLMERPAQSQPGRRLITCRVCESVYTCRAIVWISLGHCPGAVSALGAH